MSCKRSSNQSDQIHQSVRTTLQKPSKYAICIGYKDFTLKDAIKMLFTLLIPATIGILPVIVQKNEIDITQKNRQNDLYISQLERQSDEEQTDALGNDTAFNNYVKNTVETILYYKSDDVNSQQYKMTRILIITALRRPNLEKKILVVQILYGIQFAQRGEFIFDIAVRDEEVKHLGGTILNNLDFSNGFDFELYHRLFYDVFHFQIPIFKVLISLMQY